MARTPEGKVKDQVVRVLKEFGVYYFFPSTHGYGRSGIPDIVCCMNGGKFLAIECKAKGGIPTALQSRELNQILRNNGLALIVTPAEIPLLRLILQENSRA